LAATGEHGSTRAGKAYRLRSAIWSAALIPFVFLPYRWLWISCGLGATPIVVARHVRWSALVRRDGTLVIGSVVVLVVRTALDPAWWVPWIGVLVFVCAGRTRGWWLGKRPVAAICVLWMTSVAVLWRPDIWRLAADGDRRVDPDAVLVCAGDSLTSGLTPGSDADTYVAHLRKALGCTVVNAGAPSDRVGDLLARLDKDVLSRSATATLVFIGGNDYLDGTSRREFARQLDQVASRIADSGSKIIIVEVPSGIIWNPYAGVYRKVAHRYNAFLVPESRLRWWYTVELLARDHLDHPLTLDGIHLSPVGAEKVAEWLEPYVARVLAESENAAGLLHGRVQE